MVMQGATTALWDARRNDRSTALESMAPDMDRCNGGNESIPNRLSSPNLVFSALPFWWERRRTAAKISTAFLVTFCFIGFSAGILNVMPAAILMTIAAFPARRV
jgi:hypothetical protein